MYKIISFLMCVFMAGCTKDFNLDLTNAGPKYVIEGRVSSLKAPYFVRITLSTNGVTFDHRSSDLLDSTVGVENALVVISDGVGLSDTLLPCTEDNTQGYSYNWFNGRLDSTLSPFARNVYTHERGYYLTDRFTGIPGHTYTLSVHIGNEEFHASAYMPPVTPLDSALLKDAVIAPDGSRGMTPFAYFSEPQQETNYYLLQSFDITDYPSDNPEEHSANAMVFSYYVFNDKTLPAYVDGMMSRVLIPSSDRSSALFAYNIYPNTPWHVRLGSLTKEAFNYFSQLGKQFEGDGSAYQPAPATPAGNISGNALGMFYATDVSYKLILP